MKTQLRATVILLALAACQGSEPIAGPDPAGIVSLDPTFDITGPADGGTCPDVFYEHTELLENGATVTWTNVLGGFDYGLGTEYSAEVRWSVDGGTGEYVEFTKRNGKNTWTPRFGKDDGVDGMLIVGAAGAGSVAVTVSMDPMKSVGGSDGNGDDWAGLKGTGHFWLRLDVDNGFGEVESVKLGVNFHLEDPADGHEPFCPGTEPVGPVIPPPPPPPILYYLVGGTVSGLSGTVGLLNNGGDALSVSSNGGFDFLTPLGDGESYDVTVGTQPTGQTCDVTSGTGTIAAADVTDVSVTCSDDPSPPPPPPPPPPAVSYAADLQPYFNSNCTGCHEGSNPPKGVNLTSYQQVMVGGDGGAIVIPTDPDGSVLVQQLEDGHRNQSAGDIATIRTWIQEGAKNN